MRRTFTLLATVAFVLSLAGAADAATACKDAKGKFTKCPPAAAATAAAPATPAATKTSTSTKAPPNCKKGKLCGNACIKATDVCHK